MGNCVVVWCVANCVAAAGVCIVCVDTNVPAPIYIQEKETYIHVSRTGKMDSLGLEVQKAANGREYKVRSRMLRVCHMFLFG